MAFSCNVHSHSRITASSYQVGFRFWAEEPQTYRCSVLCVLNNAVANATEINLKGVAYLPKLELDVPGALFFKPTCVGASSQRTVTVTNTSRLSVAFQWSLLEKDCGVFEASPCLGTLEGKESCEITWTFKPSRRKMFNGK